VKTLLERWMNNIVANGPDVKRWFCKQRPFLGNVRNIHAHNNKTRGLCSPFISNGSVNTPTTIGVLLETVFSIRSMQNGYKEEFVENGQSSSGVLSEQLVESWALKWRLRRWRYEFSCGVLTSEQRRDHGSWRFSIVKIRYQETSSENTAEE
jgi:hypothetical protein